jgi:tetratricopeptide (TPR) repeat protein
LLVTSDGRVKLLDFGIAKLLEGGETEGAGTLLTRKGTALTPEYAAPEQLTGDAITTATDVYSLGVLLYVLLAGQHPVGRRSESAAELVKGILEIAPRRLSDVVATGQGWNSLERNAERRGTTADKLRRSLKGDLDTIVAKALKKSPQERYASVMALADDLRRYLDHQPIRARPDTLAYRTAKFVRRRARGVLAAAAVVVVVVGLVGFYTVRLRAERDRARLEAEKAAKMSELLTGLWTTADPYEPRQEEPTIRSVLDAGALRVEKELANQPELQAEMLTTIGRMYDRLGDYDRALPLLERALAIARQGSPPQHGRIAQVLNDLGAVRRERGDYAAATPILEEALAIRRQALGPEHREVAVTLVELGRVYSDQGANDRAEPLLREALAIRRKVLGEEHEETATSMSDLGLLLRMQGDLDGAEALLRQTLDTTRKLHGDDFPDVATALNNVALIAGERGDFATAEALLRQASGISRKTLGDKHPSLAAQLNNLSRALSEQGKHDEAAAPQEEAVSIVRATFGAHHPTVGQYLAALARVHLTRGDYVVAERMAREALAIRRRTLPEDDWRLASSKSILGAVLTELRRYDEAETLLTEAARALKDVPGPQGREAKMARARLEALNAAQRR